MSTYWMNVFLNETNSLWFDTRFLLFYITCDSVHLLINFTVVIEAKEWPMASWVNKGLKPTFVQRCWVTENGICISYNIKIKGLYFLIISFNYLQVPFVGSGSISLVGIALDTNSISSVCSMMFSSTSIEYCNVDACTNSWWTLHPLPH